MFRIAAFLRGFETAGAPRDALDDAHSSVDFEERNVSRPRRNGELPGRVDPERAQAPRPRGGTAEDGAESGSSSGEGNSGTVVDGALGRPGSLGAVSFRGSQSAPVQSWSSGDGKGRDVGSRPDPAGEDRTCQAGAGGVEGRAGDRRHAGVEGGKRVGWNGTQAADLLPGLAPGGAREGGESARDVAEASAGFLPTPTESAFSATASAADAVLASAANAAVSASGDVMRAALAGAISEAIEEAVRGALALDDRASANAAPRRPSSVGSVAQGSHVQPLASSQALVTTAVDIVASRSASQETCAPLAAVNASIELPSASPPTAEAVPSQPAAAALSRQPSSAKNIAAISILQAPALVARLGVPAAQPTSVLATKHPAAPTASPSEAVAKLSSAPQNAAEAANAGQGYLPLTPSPVAVAPLPTSLASFSFWAAEDRVPSVEPGPFSAAESAALRSLVGQLESRGMIRESKSKYASRALLLDADGRDSIVPTAVVGDRRVQLGVDWRGLDAAMSLAKVALYKNAIPHQRLTEARFFSRIDLRGGSLRMPLREGTRRFTAFWTPLGTYEWCVVPSGLRGVTTAFAHALSDLFRNAAVCESTVVLPSAVVVFSETRERHVRDLAAVGDVLRRVRLEPNAWGSSYYASEVELQGLRVRDGKIEVAPSRYAALERLQLGKAKCAGTEQLWRRNLHPKHHGAEDRGADGVQNIVLTEMKRVLAPVSGPFVLYVAFRKSPVGAVGGFLARRSYLGGLKQEEVVAFASRRTKIPASIHKQYALAVAACLDEFRPIIAGHKVEVRCSLGPIEQLVDGNVSAEAVAIANDLREFGASVSYCPIGSNQVARMLAG